ncbi:hypothetical protein J3D55_001730 [Chryseobacterium ginsenosidimutans]|uniref:hypothetical protein n=1 Tax=Chryseobacterium ginsenosidimutans TaxID=687846 RepID=UPI0021687BFF|nr:hypothetical protein [Chryseobacterium ginsenosidimutans]MCS3868814.1 hypothetical protein [Chryseobacterium ginsenosidimutans]
MKNFFVDFGFDSFSPVDYEENVIESTKDKSNDDSHGTISDIKINIINSQYRFGPRVEVIWTILIYIFLSLGIFCRRTVNFPEPLSGINTFVFKWGIIAASFIIGLAVLAPLLRIISKFHKGKLSWQHCLTAFSIGFFGDLTFELLINGFVNILK